MYVEMSKDAQGVAEETEKIVLSGASGMLGTALRAGLTSDRRHVLQLVTADSARSGRIVLGSEGGFADPGFDRA